MGSLFIQLIEKAKRRSPNILKEEGWTKISKYISEKEGDSFLQLKTLVRSFYYNADVITTSEGQQLIADMVTIFLVLGKPSAQQYEQLIEMLYGIASGKSSNSAHAQNLLEDLVILKKKEIKSSQEKQNFNNFLGRLKPGLSNKKDETSSTTVLFAPFSLTKGDAYLNLVSTLLETQEINHLEANQINANLKSSLLSGCYDANVVKDFFLLINNQFSTGNITPQVYTVLMEGLASRLAPKTYIDFVKSLLNEHSSYAEKFLPITLPIIFEKLKSLSNCEVEDRVTFINFIRNDLQQKFPSLSGVFNEYINNTILLKDFYNGNTVKAFFLLANELLITNNVKLETYKILMEGLANRLPPKSYINFVKGLLNDHSSYAEKFLPITLPIIFEKLKSLSNCEVEDRVTFIHFIHNDLRQKFPNLVNLFNEYVNNTIKLQLGLSEENYHNVINNIQTIKVIEKSINNISNIPEDITTSCKVLGGDFEKRLTKLQDDISRSNELVNQAKYAESLENKLSGKGLDITNLQNNLIGKSQKETEIILHDYSEQLIIKSNAYTNTMVTLYKEDNSAIENFFNEINTEFKQQINIEELKEKQLMSEIELKQPELRTKTLNLEEIERKIPEIKIKQENAETKLFQFFAKIDEKSSPIAESNFVQFLQNEMSQYIPQKINQIESRIKDNRTNQWWKDIQYNLAKNLFFRVILFLPSPPEIAQELAILKEEKKSLRREHNFLTSIKNYHIGNIIKLVPLVENKENKVFLRPISEWIINSFQSHVKEFLKANPQSHEAVGRLSSFLEEIVETYKAYRSSTANLAELEKQKEILSKELPVIGQTNEKLAEQLGEVIKKISELKKAYPIYQAAQAQFKQQKVEAFLAEWRKEYQLSSEEKIDFKLYSTLQERLFICVKEGYTIDVEYLIKNAINWDILDEYGNTLLFLAYKNYAAAKTQEEKDNFNNIVNILENNGAKLAKNEMDKEGNTVLHLIAKTGDVDLVRQWINKYGVLQEAAKVLNFDLGSAQQLVHKYGQELQGAVSFLNLLNLPINQQNQQGNTALHLAVEHQNAEMIDFLLEQGAEINIKNEAGQTPFKTPQAVKFLSTLDKGTPLYTKLVERQLIKKERQYNATDYQEEETNLLEQAVTDKSVKIDSLYYWLLEIKQSDFRENSVRERWMDKLEQAAETNSVRNALINAQDKYGNTLLHIAIEQNNFKDVKILVNNYHADAMLKNNKEETAFELAITRWGEKKASTTYQLIGDERPPEQIIYSTIVSPIKNEINKSPDRRLADMRLLNTMERQILNFLEEYAQVEGIKNDFQDRMMAKLNAQKNQIKNHETAILLIKWRSLDTEKFKNFLSQSKLGQLNKEELDQFLKKSLLNKQQFKQMGEERGKLLNEIKQTLSKAKRLPWYQNEDGDNLFHRAVKQGNIEWLKSVLASASKTNPGELKTLLNQYNASGYTPLHLAVAFAASGFIQDQKTSLDLVKLLVDNGADINARNVINQEEGVIKKSIEEPALNIAINLNSLMVFDYLLSKGANVDLQDTQGETALHLLARRKGDTAGAMIGKLLQLDPSVDIKNNAGKTAREIAEECANQNFIKPQSSSQGQGAALSHTDFFKRSRQTNKDVKQQKLQHPLPPTPNNQTSDKQPPSPLDVQSSASSTSKK